MIKFRKTIEPVWVLGNNKIFDKTEIGTYPEEDRGKLRFLIAAYTPAINKKLVEKHTSLVMVDEFKELLQEKSDKADQKMIQALTKLGLGSKKEFDNDEYAKDILFAIVKGWDGIMDADDILIEFNKENMILLFDGGYPKLGEALITCGETLFVNYDDYVKDLEKN